MATRTDLIDIPEQSLICYRKLSGEELKRWSDASLLDHDAISNDAVFTLKTVLRISMSTLESFLLKTGKAPASWISLRESCNETVGEGKLIYEEMLELWRNLENVREQLEDTFKRSYCYQDGGHPRSKNPNEAQSLHLMVTDECRTAVNERLINSINNGQFCIEDISAVTKKLLSNHSEVDAEETFMDYGCDNNKLEEYTEDPLSVPNPDEFKEEKEEEEELCPHKIIMEAEGEDNKDLETKPEEESSEENECPKCERTFTTELGLKTHLLKSHKIRIVSKASRKRKGKIWTCGRNCCYMSFLIFSEYQAHLREHNKDNCRFKCRICGMDGLSEHQARRHRRDVHGLKVVPRASNQRTAECPICHSMYSNMLSLKNHIARIHKETKVDLKPDKFPCTWEGCGMALTSKMSLQQHMSRHVRNPNYVSKRRSKGDAPSSQQPDPCYLCGKLLKSQNYSAFKIRT